MSETSKMIHVILAAMIIAFSATICVGQTAGGDTAGNMSGQEVKRAGAGQTAEDVPLSVQLEGLAPAPRLAYLRHLLSLGREDAEVMFQTAVAFHELGEADSALHYYDRAIELDPDDYKALVNKGVLLDDEGDYANAIMSFARAATIKPDDVLARSHLAFLLHQNGDHREAWLHLEAALEAGPDHAQPHFYLAIFFWDAKIYREAIREWETVMELEPNGFLASKAHENIVMLQKAIESTSPEGGWKPGR